MIPRFFLWLMRTLNVRMRVITQRKSVWPYLVRWYLFGGPRTMDFDQTGQPKPGLEWKDRPFNIFLHRFMDSDGAQEFHNHPWKWGLSIVLWGGYYEDRLRPCIVDPDHCPGHTERRKVKPFRINWITKKTFHRVDLVKKECWTLFIAGPRFASWGFVDYRTGKFTPWREYLGVKGAA